MTTPSVGRFNSTISTLTFNMLLDKNLDIKALVESLQAIEQYEQNRPGSFTLWCFEFASLASSAFV